MFFVILLEILHFNAQNSQVLSLYLSVCMWVYVYVGVCGCVCMHVYQLENVSFCISWNFERFVVTYFACISFRRVWLDSCVHMHVSVCMHVCIQIKSVSVSVFWTDLNDQDWFQRGPKGVAKLGHVYVCMCMPVCMPVCSQSELYVHVHSACLFSNNYGYMTCHKLWWILSF